MKIGLRIPGACRKEPFPAFVAWCKESGFDSIDLGSAEATAVETVQAAGLEIGTIDLPGTGKLLSPDEAVRREGIDTVTEAIEAMAEAGATRAFCVFFPANPQQSRRESFDHWKASFPECAAVAEKHGVRLAVEGWPGPNNSALGVTPEQWRAMFAAVPSEALGINFDPSHLIRVGVDYKRFLDEFAGRVVHAHGKDTSLDAEGAYLYGNLGPSFDKTVGFGGGDWRYCIPGEGDTDWAWVCGRLQQAGFEGVVSIELEDFRYNGTYAGEQKGLLRSRANLLPYL
jgi:sugar phosphate isomerase/epimerase